LETWKPLGPALIKTVVGTAAALILLFASTPAAARTGMAFSTGLMALTNATTQGGNGTAGSTVLTESACLWADGWYGAGAFFQYDKQGDSEVDTAAGPRLELLYDPFFVALEYALMMNRSFTDRAIAEQKGHGFAIEIGARFGIGGGGDDSGAFLFGSYVYRMQTVSRQDGKALDEEITQTDGYPLFGLGIGF
jgi:hypothetical protein